MQRRRSGVAKLKNVSVKPPKQHQRRGRSKKIKLEQAMDANISDFSVKAQRKRNEVIRKISKALPQQPEGDRADLISSWLSFSGKRASSGTDKNMRPSTRVCRLGLTVAATRRPVRS